MLDSLHWKWHHTCNCPDGSINEGGAYNKLLEELKLKRSKELVKVRSIKNNKVANSSPDNVSGEAGYALGFYTL